MRLRRGYAIASVLLLMVLALGVVFTIAVLSSFQLSTATTASTGARALYLAEGAASTAIENIHLRHTSTAAPTPATPDDVTFLGFTSRESGTVSFHDTGPYGSVDNTDGSVVGPVPAGMARVVATGQVNGIARRIEVMLKQEPFNYAVAVAGQFNVHGDLDVSALQTMDQVNATPAPTPSPADVGVGGNVSISGTGTISGNLVVARLTPPPSMGGVVVQGRIRTGTIDLPNIDVSTFDPGNRPDIVPLPSLTGSVTQLDSGVYIFAGPGSMHVSGNLSLSGAVLYVHGNLNIDGGISGTGAVFVDGSVTVGQCASFSAQNLVALLANGDVTLHGTGPSGSFFQGLVYTHGNFNASQVTVAGSFIAAPLSNTAPAPGVTLDSTRVVYVPAAATITVAGETAAALFPIDVTRTKSDGAFDFYYPNNPVAHSIPDGSFYPMIVGQMGPLVQNDILAQFQNDPVVQKIWNPVPIVGPLPSPTPVDPVNYGYLGNFWVPDNGPNGGVYMFWPQIRYNASTQKMETLGLPPYLGYISNSTAPCPPAEFDARIQAYYGVSLAELTAGLARIQQAVVDRANQLLASNLGGGGPGSSLKLSLEQFLNDTLPLRVVSWREL